MSHPTVISLRTNSKKHSANYFLIFWIQKMIRYNYIDSPNLIDLLLWFNFFFFGSNVHRRANEDMSDDDEEENSEDDNDLFVNPNHQKPTCYVDTDSSSEESDNNNEQW